MDVTADDTLVFLRVVEQGSFAAAARALRLPKTTVSRRVRMLESKLGVQLLHRTTRKLAPTEAGAVYYRHCARIPVDLDLAEQAVSELSGMVRGTLRMTTAFSIADWLLGPMLAELGRRHPALRVELVLANERLDLIEHGLDLALRLSPGVLPDSDNVGRPLCAMTLALYAAPDYLAAHGSPDSPADLVHHRTLALRAQLSGGGYVWRLQRKGETSDAALHPSVIASDPAPLLRAAADGAGIVMAGGPQVREAVAAGALQRVLPQWTGPRMQLFAFYPRERLMAPKMRAFIDFLVEQTAAHEDEIGGASG